MAPSLPPPAPDAYAYVVDYRPLDACSPAACRLKSAEAVGYADQLENSGDPGSYVRAGNQLGELFYRRGTTLRGGDSFSFRLPASDAPSELDLYAGAHDGGPWSLRIEISTEDGKPVETLERKGTSKEYVVPEKSENLANYDDYFAHLRLPLPPRTGRALVVKLVNREGKHLDLGSPLVLRRESGREARQFFSAVFDAVPDALMQAMLEGKHSDASVTWVSEAVGRSGWYFPRGASPGLNTGTFGRRFFRGGFFELAGEPNLLDQGVDPEPSELISSPVARLAEQGFLTETMMGNFLLLPVQTRTGFDGGWHSELQARAQNHTIGIARRFKQWIAEHPRDDAFVQLWFSTTHDPAPTGRPGGPYDPAVAAYLPHPDKPADEMFGRKWSVFLQDTDTLKTIWDAAARSSPNGNRVWFYGTDHGEVVSKLGLARDWRNGRGELPSWPCAHCCMAASEEANTPFAFVFDGSARVAPAVAPEPRSELVVWRVLERSFGVSLGLPRTETYALPPALAPDDDQGFREPILVSVGDAGAIRAIRKNLRYRAFNPRLTAQPLWSLSHGKQLLMAGTPNRSDFLAEELYDYDADRAETRNLARERPDEILRFRREVADWLALYFDPFDRPRYRYTLRFAERISLDLEAPRPFTLGVDDQTPALSRDRKVHFEGTTLTIEDQAVPVRLIRVMAAGGGKAPTLRCASTHLPLGADPGTWNLALAATNCTREAPDPPRPGEVAFSAKLLSTKALSQGTTGANQELLEGLKRWGYVRDIDKKP